MTAQCPRCRVRYGWWWFVLVRRDWWSVQRNTPWRCRCGVMLRRVPAQPTWRYETPRLLAILAWLFGAARLRRAGASTAALLGWAGIGLVVAWVMVVRALRVEDVPEKHP